MNKSTIIALLLSFLSLSAWAQPVFNPQSAPKREVRAIWLTTIGGLDWPHNYAQAYRSRIKQQEELRTLLDKYQQAGINTILLQTRIRATTIYPSAYEPWDGCLSGKPGVSPDYDALAFAIEECHNRGMELHAWVVTIPVGKWNGTGCTQLRKKYPRLIKKIGEDGYMDPENPATADYISNICEEITRNYDIDGIHLDYIRYPETWKIKVSREQGRQYITNIVTKISNRVKSIKPWVKMSCSPVGKHDDLARYWSHGWNAYTKVCQDAQNWLKNGLMDQLYPMMYFRDNNFYPFAIDWAEQSYGKTIVPGLGIYFLSPREGKWEIDDVTREMYITRKYGMGHAYFRGKFFTDNTKGIYDFAADNFDKHLALVPAMTWQNKAKPNAPSRIDVNDYTLSWTPVDEEGVTYNVYASNEYPVDINDARNLVAIRLNRCSVTLDGKKRYYAVTAMNRYGNESLPLQEQNEEKTKQTIGGLLTCNGRIVVLPDLDQGCESEMVTFTTLQGAIKATKRYNKYVDISNLPNGMYIARTINARGISHRIGMFMVKRNIK